MKNKISIDELVRQGIAKGEEPHNLGAWANMERMLDGKDPYQQEEEDSRRKPWLFMLLGLIACSTAVIGGYNYLSNTNNTTQNSINKNAVAKVSPTTDLAASGIIEDHVTTIVENSLTTEDLKKSSSPYTKTTKSIVEKSNSLFDPHKEETIVVANHTQNIAKETKQLRNTSRSNISQKITSQTQSKIAKVSTLDKGIDTKAIQHSLESINKQTNQTELIAKTTSLPILVDSKGQQVAPTIQEKHTDTINATKLTYRIEQDRFGNKKHVVDSSKFKIVEEKERVVVNPRYVELTAQQEEEAQRRTAIASNAEFIAPPKIEPISSETSNDHSVGLQAKASSSKEAKSKKSFFSMFKTLAQKVNQKAIQIAHTPVPIYTGMFAGVNAALINTQHNFGGFQGGFTAMTPLSRLFSLQTEARLMHKNNSGYTVRDNKSTIINKTVDNTSWTHGTIYNYEIDSVSTGYNLKSFYTLQVPVLLNAHIKKFNAYGGVHLNYGFRMNTSATQSSSPLYVSDTVTTGASYVERTNTTPKFTRDDFSSRLGLGYTIGGSYNFNSQLYLDLRMSNLFWDNTQGAAKQEISDVFFKIPSFQLSLGYRFRKFDKER